MKKEVLYREMLELENKVCELKNGYVSDYGEDYFQSYAFQRDVKRVSKKKLERDIQQLKLEYEREVLRLRVENYFNTEEGKSEKENLTNELLKVREGCEKWCIRQWEKVDAFIKEWLGEEWGVDRLDNGYMHIGLVKERAVTYNNLHFGRDFSVRFANTWKIDDKLEMNYPCIGSFNLFEEVSMVTYLKGMGKFASDKEKLGELRNMLMDFALSLGEYTKEMERLKGKLENPFKAA